MPRKFRALLLLALLWAGPVLAAPSPAALKAKLTKLIQRHPHWETGISVWFLQGDKITEKVDINGAQPLALASVFKVPVLVELARQMQRKQGGLQLSSGLSITESEKCIGSGRLQHQRAGTVVSVERLIELMELSSDNTATDMLFHRIGVASVNKLLEELGCNHSDIALTNRAAWLISLGQSSDFRSLSPEQVAKKWTKMSRDEHAKAAARAEKENLKLSLRKFQDLENRSDRTQTHEQNVLVATTVDNLSSSADLATVLTQLYQGKVLNREMTRFCLRILSRQHFNTRIPRNLPEGTLVYHKTGTIAGVVNDIGIIEIPDVGSVVVVALVNQVGRGESSQADEFIAQVARAAYDELLR